MVVFAVLRRWPPNIQIRWFSIFRFSSILGPLTQNMKFLLRAIRFVFLWKTSLNLWWIILLAPGHFFLLNLSSVMALRGSKWQEKGYLFKNCVECFRTFGKIAYMGSHFEGESLLKFLFRVDLAWEKSLSRGCSEKKNHLTVSYFSASPGSDHVITFCLKSRLDNKMPHW